MTHIAYGSHVFPTQSTAAEDVTNSAFYGAIDDAANEQ